MHIENSSFFKKQRNKFSTNKEEANLPSFLTSLYTMFCASCMHWRGKICFCKLPSHICRIQPSLFYCSAYSRRILKELFSPHFFKSLNAFHDSLLFLVRLFLIFVSLAFVLVIDRSPGLYFFLRVTFAPILPIAVLPR